MNTETKVASGVDALVDKLRDLGVQRGKDKEQEIVAKAKEEAEKLVSDAQKKADDIVAGAKKKLVELENTGKSAVEVAYRDAVLGVEQKLQKMFAAMAKNAISDSLADEKLIKSLVLTVAGNVSSDISLGDNEKCEIVLPETVAGKDADLQKFVNSFAEGMLKKGVEITSGTVKSGISVKLVDRDLEVDLSDSAISDYVLQYLRPRFRAILDGEK